MFRLVPFRGSRLATSLSLTSLASQWEWGGGGGVSTECLSAVVLWVSSGSLPTVQHFLLSST